MPEPTDEQLKDYAKKLPELYKHIFQVITKRDLNRRYGDGFTRDYIEVCIVDEQTDIRYSDVSDAVDQLIDRNFFQIQPSRPQMVYLTPLGERLMTAVTGIVPRPAQVEKLPAPTWG